MSKWKGIITTKNGKQRMDNYEVNLEEQLKEEEMQNELIKENLKSQFATLSGGGRRTKHSVFTEQGVAMLSANQMCLQNLIGCA